MIALKSDLRLWVLRQPRGLRACVLAKTFDAAIVLLVRVSKDADWANASLESQWNPGNGKYDPANPILFRECA